MQAIIDGVILTGGRSSRMGTDKSQLLLPNGMSLFARAQELLRRVVNGSIWISRPWDYHPSESYELCDDEPYAGPLAGIEKAMRVSTADYLAILAVDLPSLPWDFYSRLLTRWAQPDEALLPRSRDFTQPLAGFWSLTLLGDLHRYRQDGGQKVGHFLASHRIHWVEVPESWLVNINTPEDWASWIPTPRPGKGS